MVEKLDTQLGKHTKYPNGYSPKLLQAVPRSLNRAELGCVETQPFSGSDVWHAYELSWLNSSGKPLVAIGRFTFAASTPNIIESKSFKLYLNSLNQTRFDSHEKLNAVLSQDLGRVVEGEVTIELISPTDNETLLPQALPGVCIDALDISVDHFNLSPEMLAADSQEGEFKIVSETLHSHLLKSNCLITNQPDWASVVIEYRGQQIDREALLRYLLSFRMHNEFHEQCVERIYCDILAAYKPEQLSVQALYTRRGGLDINPFRTSLTGEQAPARRINRQ